jgi:uncharacterized protein (DUF433 family)
MSDTIQSAANDAARNSAPGKKPLNPHLFAGAKGTVDDVRVQTGYPVWNLIETWMVGNFDDNEVLAGYSDMPREEWEAAKQYYLDHKAFIDARILTNSQPAADDDVPPMRTADEYFAWLDEKSKADAGNGKR